MHTTIYEKSIELSNLGTSFVLVTVTGIRGEAPTNLGNKIIVSSIGIEAGTVGGGKVEARIIVDSQEFLKSKKTDLETVTYNLQKDIGMTCGGEMTFLFEPHNLEKWEIAVFGAGHIAQALIPILCTLNCRITCFDSREKWREKLPKHPHLRVCDVSEVDNYLKETSENTFFASMTMGHATDVPILEAVFRRFPNPKYIGVIGSEIKAGRIRSDLLDRGIAATSIEKLKCPIGLDIGTNVPTEIAISIAAEMLQSHSGTGTRKSR